MCLSGPSVFPKTSFKRKPLNCLRKPVAGLFFEVGGLFVLFSGNVSMQHNFSSFYGYQTCIPHAYFIFREGTEAFSQGLQGVFFPESKKVIVTFAGLKIFLGFAQ